MDYLEEAADLLRKARDDNEKRAALVPSLRDGNLPTREILAEVNTRRMEIADGFMRLAAIQAETLAAAWPPERKTL